MALLRTSEVRFLDAFGGETEGPLEWTAGFVELLVPAVAWTDYRLTVNGVQMPLALRNLWGHVRVLASWPRSGTGTYEISVASPAGTETFTVTIRPVKISEAQFGSLVEDLEVRLPVAVAISLQRLGGLAGIQFARTGQSTLAAELTRIRRSCEGAPGSPGITRLLPIIAADPHRTLAGEDIWRPAERARRPHASGLATALLRAGNVGGDRRPRVVLDSRVEHTFDVYENRILRGFSSELDRRGRRLLAALLAVRSEGAVHELSAILIGLRQSRRSAHFLDEVSDPATAATRTTMVLLKRPDYRAMFERHLEFHRIADVVLEQPGLDSPLENLPSLYQIWCTLYILDTLLNVGAELGYRLVRQRAVVRGRDGFFVRVLPDGLAAVELAHPRTGATVHLIPERTFGAAGEYRSLTFTQRPDVTIVVRSPSEAPRLVLFDPKYKLDSESVTGLEDDSQVDRGSPKKIDIDKMHAYRDAVRWHDSPVVEFAGVLYPGRPVLFDRRIAALRAVPGDDVELDRELRRILATALS